MTSGVEHTLPVAGDSDEFVGRLLASQRGIHAFLVSLMPYETDLDDVVQQVCLMLWKERDKYDPSRPFLPWAYAFTRNIASTHLRSRARDRNHIALSPEVLERIAFAREGQESTAEARRVALGRCVEQLLPSQRELLLKRYESPESLKHVAAATKVSAAALTMRLQRIRHALLKCVEQSIAAGERAS